MTEPEQETLAPPTLIERGRYAVFGDSPMTIVICRKTDLCESCLACGCGTVQENITTADILKDFLKNPFGAGKALKELMGHGPDPG